MPETTFNPFTNNIDYVGDPPSGDTVLSDVPLSDNTVIRGDGGGRKVQDSGVTLDDSDNITAVESLTFNLGTDIKEFSIDGTLSGNSDDAVPTEKAVKTYVDSTGGGDVFGPAGATDNALARYDGATGKLIQDSVGI